MMSDALTVRVRAAIEAFPVPAFPGERIAERVASAALRAPRRTTRLALAAAAGLAVLVAALAAGGPTFEKASPGFMATMRRLTGRDWSNLRTVNLSPMSLAEARRHTHFPIVVPRGKRVLDARPHPNDAGVTLTLAVDVHAQAMLFETWSGTQRSKLEGVGIHDDGSIRRFNVRRWRIGKIDFSMPMWTRDYHRYAEEVERATRAALPDAER